MEFHPVEDEQNIFCPRCKKRTKHTIFMFKTYTCSECGLKFNSSEYSKLLKEYTSKKASDS